MWTGLLLSVLFDIVLAIVIFQVAKNQGASDFAAYLWASIGPAIGAVIGLVRTRKVDGVAIIIIVNLLLSAAVTFIGSQDPKVLLLKDSVLTGGFGLIVLLTSLPFFPKPLMFFFGLKFGSDGTKEGTAQWYAMWDQYPQFRQGQRFINNVWGIGFVVEALVKAGCVFALPYDAAFMVNQIAPFVLIGSLIYFSIRFGMKQRREGEARRNAAQIMEVSR